jgi:phasin family protein
MMSVKKSNYANPAKMPPQAVEFVEASADAVADVLQDVSAATSKSVAVLDTVAVTTAAGVTDLQKKAMEFAGKNMEQVFAFSRKLFAVREFGEVVSLQQSFVTEQGESFRAQASALSELAFRVSAEAAKPLTESIEKSLQTFAKSFAA